MFTPSATAADTTNPQKPHFFHLKSAITHTRLKRHTAIRTGNAQSGMCCGELRLIASLPSRQRSVVAKFPMIARTRYVARRAWRFYTGGDVGFITGLLLFGLFPMT